MKHFVTLVACLASFITLAQNPNYDPDSNGDDLIGAEDLVSLLGVYNTSLAVDTTLECDFDGTAEDDWLYGIFTGEVILDSIIVQFSISDSATYYEPGCPTPQVSFLNVEWQYVLTNLQTLGDTRKRFYQTYDNPWESQGTVEVDFRFDGNTGRAWWLWTDNALGALRSSGPNNTSYNFPYYSNALYSCINSDSDNQTFSLTEDGAIGGIRCDGEEWCCGVFAETSFYHYFRLLPYWHFAE